jgi:hypothetical protein
MFIVQATDLVIYDVYDLIQGWKKQTNETNQVLNWFCNYWFKHFQNSIARTPH